MSEVKWIKLSTQMFEDEKIRIIEQLPEADTILVIWIKLLAQAGKTNASGYIYLNENIPYTDEMISTIFNRPISVVRMALNTFKHFGMIEINDDHYIRISNWTKHQNIQGLDKIREQTRKRVAEYRKRQNNDILPVTLPVTLRNATEEELEEELDKEIEKEIEKEIPYVEIINYLNDATQKSYRHSSKKTKSLIKARWNEGFNLDDFKRVIDNKSSEWLHDQKMNDYLRPDTLFGTKFEGYLNQKASVRHEASVYDDAF